MGGIRWRQLIFVVGPHQVNSNSIIEQPGASEIESRRSLNQDKAKNFGVEITRILDVSAESWNSAETWFSDIKGSSGSFSSASFLLLSSLFTLVSPFDLQASLFSSIIVSQLINWPWQLATTFESPFGSTYIFVLLAARRKVAACTWRNWHIRWHVAECMKCLICRVSFYRGTPVLLSRDDKQAFSVEASSHRCMAYLLQWGFFFVFKFIFNIFIICF